MIRFGWVEWNEVTGPNGRVWADDKLLPTRAVYWSHNCRNNGEFDPACPTCKDERDNPDSLMVSVFFSLENGMASETILTIRDGIWSIDMALLVELDESDALHSGFNSTCYRVDRERHLALCVHDSEKNIHFEDPEDYEDMIRILSEWSSLQRVFTDEPDVVAAG